MFLFVCFENFGMESLTGLVLTHRTLNMDKTCKTDRKNWPQIHITLVNIKISVEFQITEEPSNFVYDT